jgi:hypothetical protein
VSDVAHGSLVFMLRHCLTYFGFFLKCRRSVHHPVRTFKRAETLLNLHSLQNTGKNNINTNIMNFNVLPRLIGHVLRSANQFILIFYLVYVIINHLFLFYSPDVTVNLMQGYYDLDSTLHIRHTGQHTLTIQAYNDQEVHVVTPIVHFPYQLLSLSTSLVLAHTSLSNTQFRNHSSLDNL